MMASFQPSYIFLLWPPIQLLWPPVRKLYLPHTKIKIYPKIHQSSQKINQKVDINHFNPNIYLNDSKLVKKTKIFFFQNVRKNEKRVWIHSKNHQKHPKMFIFNRNHFWIFFLKNPGIFLKNSKIRQKISPKN